MTRILIVDDDPGQLRMLAHLITVRGRGLSVLTANTGTQAIETLQSSQVDLVLTDLQMPGMSGFELLTWLVTNRPQIPIFTMTAYPDAESVDRLDELGTIECFTKPLDITAVLQRLSLALAEGVGGHVRNIGMPAFLQLVEMERKTCVLTIEAAGKSGMLHFDDGVLVDARTGDLRGDEAALTIAGWPSPSITIRTARGVRSRTVAQPLGFILMESMRRQDEARRAVSPGSGRALASFPLVTPPESGAIAIIDSSNARVEAMAGECAALDARAKLAATIYRAEVAAVAELRLEDDVDEIVLTTADAWTIVRRVVGVADALVMVVFDPNKSTLVMVRLGLDDVARRLQAWCTGESGTPSYMADLVETTPLDVVDDITEWDG